MAVVEWERCVADDLGEAWARGVMARGGRVVRVTYPRTANNDKELTVVRGEYLEVRTRRSLREPPNKSQNLLFKT